MTGYSRTTRHGPSGSMTVELRSTNHRYLDVSQRMPERLAGFEGQVNQIIRSALRRGRIDITVAFQARLATSRSVAFDEALAQAYYERLVYLKNRFGLKGPVTLEQLLAFPLFDVANDYTAPQTLWPTLQKVLQAALQALVVMRRQEGGRLVKDILSHMRLIRKRLAAVRARLPQSVAQQKRRLGSRLKSFLGSGACVSRSQIQEAVALITEGDINEELIRLDSHLAHMHQALKRRHSHGKQLDFVAQEMMREANTMGAKANDAIIARYVIDIKGAVEKIREQAQNLE